MKIATTQLICYTDNKQYYKHIHIKKEGKVIIGNDCI